MRKCTKLINKIFAVIFITSFVIISGFHTIIAATLPTFAVVENSNNTSSYITSESSVQTVAPPSFNFASGAQILMEQSTGNIIYANNENERLLPASVTKVMTLLLIMEAIDNGKLALTDKVTCSAYASKMGGSQIWFKEGEQLTIEEAIKCICIVSANDVSTAMAELIGGSEENFVNLMNEKAASLGMENTHFMNAHGIDEENHYSSAKDIAIMSRELVTKHPNILKYTSIWMDSIRGGTFTLSNTNKLLKSYSGITGLKTGSTSAAGFNLTATATKNNMSLIAVVLKAPSSEIRNNEITQMLNYGFSNFQTKTYAKAHDMIQSIQLEKHVTENVNIYYEKEVTQMLEKGTSSDLTQELILNESLRAPLKNGDTVGTVIFKNSDGSENTRVNAIVTNDISRSSLMDYLRHVFNTYLLVYAKG